MELETKILRYSEGSQVITMEKLRERKELENENPKERDNTWKVVEGGTI